MNKRVLLLIPGVFFILMIGLLLFGLGRDPNMVPSALVNRPLPEFSLPDLVNTDVVIASQDLTGGGVLIINFWATWCPPCHIEHPYLVEISEREQDLTFIGVNYKDDLEDARLFLEEKGTPFEKVIVDLDGSLGIDFGLAGAPETFIVDSFGMIRYRHVGVINHQIWQETFEPVISRIK
ncbi:MAG: DsbE family thiol:disulfide interchange protein [SAR86 cluster bacterium]|uniref:DsbE family thiol:disulfide interchange protein n=1 Tax=SAR86 cluster bacterium TaxID=2030880 RepID=A0A2A5CDI6_9GAMM|nr:DsbE family thiol:disulfide interchange protein [Gammaproteobacteria bacterium AH-315-E17]PCJ41446.1 MAG: DsbE family thiol:disulfide interchange protein [SAR86 cluster bacterium]